MKKNSIIFIIFLFVIGMGLAGFSCLGSEDTPEVSEEIPDTEEINQTNIAFEKGEPIQEEINLTTPSEGDSATFVDTDSAKNGEFVLPAYEVTELEEPTTMYSFDLTNVRIGPSTDYGITGFLSYGQEVPVTGQADNGWYEILYNEEKAFVCNLYLQIRNPEEKLESENQSQEELLTNLVNSVTTTTNIIFVGDSRFVQMKNSVGKNPYTWIAESGKGYDWFKQTAISKIDSNIGEGTKILINLGVNDLGNLKKYIALINAKADEWAGKGATVYYASVNPVTVTPNVTTEQIESFNSQMQSSLNDNVHWIDSYSYLNSVGYSLVDGLHFSKETYRVLYDYYLGCM